MRTDFPDKLSFRDYLFSAPSFSYFSSLPTLETPRLLLRKIRLRDAADVFAYASDPKVAQYVLWEPHHDLRETRGYIRAIRRQYRQGLPSSWAIELKSEQKVIGSIGYMKTYTSKLPSRPNEPLVGYWVGKPYWNQGICTESLELMIKHIRAVEDCKSLISSHFVDNPASGRVMQKCGFVATGETCVDSDLSGMEKPMAVLRLEFS